MRFVNFNVCQLRYFVQNVRLLGMRLQHATLGEEKKGPLANLHQAGCGNLEYSQHYVVFAKTHNKTTV
jgi:hypothetical protein